MLTVEEARRAVMASTAALPAEPRCLANALGCVLTETISADLDSPPFDKSVVDGYAIRASDLSGSDRWLDIGEEITAGRTPSRALRPREAAIIMTGAPIPQGADTVVMIEKTRREADRVHIGEPSTAAGRNVMLRAREMRKGDVVLQAGVRLNAARLGLLATVGRTRVSVIPRPRVMIVSTGDELVEADQVPGPGQIRNSNAVVLRALVEASQAVAEPLPTAPDDDRLLSDALARGLGADILLITGGVSMGSLDLVPGCLERLGVTRIFHKVQLKPGKPLWFGTGPGRDGAPGTLVFGLPGNPVSGIVGFLLFVRPAIDALAGRADRAQLSPEGRLAKSFIQNGDRTTYHPARWNNGLIETLPWAGSADLRTVAEADGFAIFPPGERCYEPGEVVGFVHLD